MISPMSLFVLLCLITWILNGMDCDPDLCQYCLNQYNFNDGTFRIKLSGIYCLSEDITFDPIPGSIRNPNSEYAWFPRFDDANYFDTGDTAPKRGPFSLGFFAAITIEVSNVEINLMGYTIKQSKLFSLQQRFYANIEISNTPFITNQGPNGQFGQNVNIENIKIHNGELGLSSHHGIHSNNARNIEISNLKIFDFEVGGIQLNGFENVQLVDLEIGPSLTEVPLAGYYSNARFLLQGYYDLFRRQANTNFNDIKIPFNNGIRTLSIINIFNNLRDSMDIAFRNVLNRNRYNDRRNSLYDISLNLYKTNNNNIPDGSAIYGILLNSNGVAVEGFGDARNIAGNDVIIRNVKIHDLILDINEIPIAHFATCDNDRSNDFDGNAIKRNGLKGSFGEFLDIRKMLHINYWDYIDEGREFRNLKYIGNPLSDAQIGLVWAGNSFGANIPNEFLDWVLYDIPLPQCMYIMCNNDIMFHTNKGIVGLRVDNIDNVEINQVSIYDLYNISPLGSFACGSYTGKFDGGNIFQLDNEGYTGTDIRGISFINSNNIQIGNDNKVYKLISDFGTVIGIDLLENSQIDIKDKTPDVYELQAGNRVDGSLLTDLMFNNEYPFPNNFDTCIYKIASDSNIHVLNSEYNEYVIIGCQIFSSNHNSNSNSNADSNSDSNSNSNSDSDD